VIAGRAGVSFDDLSSATSPVSGRALSVAASVRGGTAPPRNLPLNHVVRQDKPIANQLANSANLGRPDALPLIPALLSH